MKTAIIKNISDYLGKSDDRYFSHGYKFIGFEYRKIHYYNNLLIGEVCIDYSWHKSRNRHAHLGTVEYIAIASAMCEQILHSAFHLTPTQVAHSWINFFRIKIQSIINLSENNVVNVSAKVLGTLKDEFSNVCKSSIEVQINSTRVRVDICHPTIDKRFRPCYYELQSTSLYCSGYKERTHDIEDVHINYEARTCTASILIKDYYSSKEGLGSMYNNTLLTDILLVSGQMVQTLFYSLENTDRTNGHNIWMREFNVSIPTPNTKMEYNAVLTFEDIKLITQNNKNWKSVTLSNRMGDIKANFKMVSQVNCTL